MNLEKLQAILQESSSYHSHLCPRQILGARVGLAGLSSLGFEGPPTQKRLLVITETDGCFVDGLIAATACTVGHRTLRVEDFGKTAAVFVDTLTGRAIRVAPSLDIREKAVHYALDETRHYFAQLQAYQTMPDSEMFTVTQVNLNISIEAIISRPGMRVICDVCGEEIMNERELKKNGLDLCLSCAGESYYSALPTFDHEIPLSLKVSLA
jgi:formylmethanofuran dehydrogenase subunit E